MPVLEASASQCPSPGGSALEPQSLQGAPHARDGPLATPWLVRQRQRCGIGAGSICEDLCLGRQSPAEWQRRGAYLLGELLDVVARLKLVAVRAVL